MKLKNKLCPLQAITFKIQPGTVYGNEQIVHLGKEIVDYNSYAKGKNLLGRNVFETQTRQRLKTQGLFS